MTHLMSGLEYGERVKYTISIEMEVPSYGSTLYLPDSLVVRFDKKKEHTEEVFQKHSEQAVRIGDKILDDISDPKLRLFIEVFRALSGENRDDVEKESLINELILTGRFTEQDVVEHIKKVQQNGLIFERKADMYALG
jgi:hypothetical protein